MKKIIMILCMLVLSVGCTQTKDSENFTYVTYEEAIEKINRDNADFFLMFVYGDSEDDCFACTSFKEELEPVLKKEKITVYVLDYMKIEDDDNIRGQLRAYLPESSYESWPVLFHIENGSVSSTYEYSIHPEEWESWLMTQQAH